MITRQMRQFGHARVKMATSSKQRPIMLVSEYGELVNLRPLTKLKSADDSSADKKDMRQVVMIDDNTDTKTLIKKMDHNPKAYFLFSPEAHYQNALALYAALKRNLNKKYYNFDAQRKGRDQGESLEVEFKK